MVCPEIDIRSATASDGEIVTILLMAQLREHSIDTPPASVRRAVEGLLADHTRGIILIALRGTAAVGVAYVSLIWSLEHGGKSAWLEELFVVPDERSRGIGTAMLAAVLQKAGADGCTAVDLEVDTTHARAQHLYARAGFKSLPRGRWVRSFTPESEPIGINKQA